MKRKIIATTLFLAMVTAYMLPLNIQAASKVDYSDKLAELSVLIDACEGAGISVEYEKINYSTIERFETYINEDIENNEAFVDYNIACIEKLYSEAKENLNAYINGEKTPLESRISDVNDMKIKGSAIYDQEGPMYSVGYGHFARVMNDVENLHSFGANNIQIEIGPTMFTENYVSKIKDVLTRAEQNNIAVHLLVSPHYFPTNLEPEIYISGETDKFIKYNIHHPTAKSVIESYLKELLPQLAGYSALQSIILSNEPVFDTRNFSSFYTERFQAYLQSIHKDLETLNAEYGTSYTDWTKINMPDKNSFLSDLPICYDWIEYNCKEFADWHKWMANIIREYLPGVPLGSKIMIDCRPIGESKLRDVLARGADIEFFGEFLDFAGNDAWDYLDDTEGYVAAMFFYDYQNSVIKKPVYNVEDHIIRDNDETYNENYAKHVRNSLWMSTVHGKNISTIWLWDRANTSPTFKNSFLYRPDVVAETGKTSLDMMRLSDNIHKLQQADKKIAIFYSKPSRVYDIKALEKMMEVYKAMINNGQRVGVVSDKSIDELKNYDVLVIPEVSYGTDEAFEGIMKFIENGGRVIYKGEPLMYDEYRNERDNSCIKNYSYAYSSLTYEDISKEIANAYSNYGLSRVTLVDEDTKEAPINLDWQFVVCKNKVIVNITDLSFDADKNVSVYLDGKKLTNMTECISGTKNISTVNVKGRTPVMLEYMINPEITIDNIYVDTEDGKIKWRSSDPAYEGANIYMLSNGSLRYLSTVKSFSYSYKNDGIYIVKPISNGTEYGEYSICVQSGSDFYFSVSCDDIKIKNSYVSGEVSIKNISDEYMSGVLAIRTIKDDSMSQGAVYNNVTLASGELQHITVSIPVNVDTNQIEIGVWDSLMMKNIYSNTIIESIGIN